MTQFTWLSPALPWSMMQVENPLPLPRIESTVVPTNVPTRRRKAEEFVYACRQKRPTVIPPWVCVCRNTSVSIWDIVSERASERAQTEGWGDEGCESSAAASTNAELQYKVGLHVHLSHSSNSLSHSNMLITKLISIFIPFISTFA